MKELALVIGYALVCLLGCSQPALHLETCEEGILPYAAANIADDVELALRQDNWRARLDHYDPVLVRCVIKALLANLVLYDPKPVQQHGKAWLAENGGE